MHVVQVNLFRLKSVTVCNIFKYMAIGVSMETGQNVHQVVGMEQCIETEYVTNQKTAATIVQAKLLRLKGVQQRTVLVSLM